MAGRLRPIARGVGLLNGLIRGIDAFRGTLGRIRRIATKTRCLGAFRGTLGALRILFRGTVGRVWRFGASLGRRVVVGDALALHSRQRASNLGPAGPDAIGRLGQGYRRRMSRIADVLRTIAAAIATVIGAIAHAVITVVTLPFRALAKLFRPRRTRTTQTS